MSIFDDFWLGSPVTQEPRSPKKVYLYRTTRLNTSGTGIFSLMPECTSNVLEHIGNTFPINGRSLFCFRFRGRGILFVVRVLKEGGVQASGGRQSHEEGSRLIYVQPRHCPTALLIVSLSDV